MELKIILQAADAASAERLEQLTGKLFQSVGQDAVAQQQIPQLARIVSALKPVRRADQITASLDNELVQQLVLAALLPIARAGEQDRRIKSASNLRQIGQGILLYANAHKGSVPENWAALMVAEEMSRGVFRNPRRPSRDPGYIYVKPTVPIGKLSPEDVVAYEAYDVWGDGTNVLYGDGHVEFVANERWFTEALEKTHQRHAAATQPAAQEP